MKVFISWSGQLSLRVAEIFRDWLPSVLQTVDPYVSSEDIAKGARWSSDVGAELELSSYGIICVTPDNLRAPWINFEAGALSKSMREGLVSPFLFKVERSQVVGPLVQFQSTVYDREDIFRLVSSINDATAKPLDHPRLEKAFATWWPQLQEALASVEDSAQQLEVVTTPADEALTRSSEDLLKEVLSLVRSQQKILTSDSTPSTTQSVERPLRLRRATVRGIIAASNRLKELDSGLVVGMTQDEAAELVRAVELLRDCSRELLKVVFFAEKRGRLIQVPPATEVGE